MTPLLSLDNFRQIMQMHPYHFWQLANSIVPVSNQCDALVYQYAWQNADAVGRSEILAAIETAENRLREWLGYSVAPHYVVETLSWPQYHTASFQSWGPAGIDGHWRTLQLSEGMIQNFGVETRTPIGTNIAVTYADTDGDGVLDTFTTTTLSTVLDASTIDAVFVSSDMPSAQNDGFNVTTDRIHPIRVIVDGVDVVITGPAWVMVKPKLYQGVAATALNPATSGVLATVIDMYQNLPGSSITTPQATLIWDTLPWPTCCTPDITGSAIADPNAIGIATGRLGITDSRLGIVHVGQATYNADTGLWVAGSCDCWRPPDRVTVRYLAGLPWPDAGALIRQIQDDHILPSWQVIVARLAAAELSRPICACAAANRELFRWQEDLARTGGNNDAQYGAISTADLDNPFGTRRGHIYAWRQVNHLRLQRGLFAG